MDNAKINLGVSSDSPTLEQAHDIFICVLGYESRCTYVASEIEKSSQPNSTKFAVTFPDRQVFSFEENKAWFDEKKFVYLNFSGYKFRQQVIAQLESGSYKKNKEISIFIDISCMSRLLMAELILALVILSKERKVSVTFLYAPAEFSQPSKGNPLITIAEPVVPDFAGWSVPGLPTYAIFGLGFEYDRAIGSLELLDPARSWALMPVGENPKFEHEIKGANRNLEDFLFENIISEYRLDRPVDLFLRLQSLVSGLAQEAKVVIVPLGPKLFALTSLLVGLVSNSSVAVWRVSGGQADLPVDSEPTGKIIKFHTTFER